MRRVIVVCNPNSSRFGSVNDEVLQKIRKRNGYVVGKYEIKKASTEQNISRLAKVLENGDMVISAGGDATGVITVNGILESNKDVTLAVLPYGNFNDLARTLGVRKIEDVLDRKTHCEKFYPLEMIVDGKLYRYATCYVTIGMMAEAVYIYDKPEMRRKLKTNFGRSVVSYAAIAGWYFKNRKKKHFLPEFCLNGEKQDKRSSDYVAVNGGSVARVMKGGKDYLDKKVFRSEVGGLTGVWRLVNFMAKSIFARVPGDETSGDMIEFCRPSTVTVQAEGEYKVFCDIRKIEVRKGDRYLNVVKIG